MPETATATSEQTQKSKSAPSTPRTDGGAPAASFTGEGGPAAALADSRVREPANAGQRVAVVQQLQSQAGNHAVANAMQQQTDKPMDSEAPHDTEQHQGAGASGLARLLPDAVIARLRKIPGYAVLTVALGADPLSGEPVKRSADNIARGVLDMIPGGEQLAEHLVESGALDRALDWIQAQLVGLGFTWAYVANLLHRAADAFSILEPFESVAPIFAEPLQRLGRFVSTASKKLLELVVESVLTLAGPLGRQVLQLFKRADDVFDAIARDPVAFLKNLLQAVRGGFDQFLHNFSTHLKSGLLNWLFGALSGAGITLPKNLDAKSTFGFIFDVLGVSYQKLRTKLAGVIGAERVVYLETTFSVLQTLMHDGLQGLWQMFLDWIGNLQERLLDSVEQWVVGSVLKSAIAKLASLFTPVGAAVQAIMSAYHTITFFIERAQQIAELAGAVVESVGNIAAGNTSTAANYVEQTLARSLPLAIGFLSNLIGIGDIGAHLRDAVEKLRGLVDEGLDKAVQWVVGKARGLWQGAKGAAQRLTEWWTARERFDGADGEQHTLYFTGTGNDAELTLASKPQTYRAFLARMQTVLKPDQRQLIQQARDLLREIELFKRHFSMRDAPDGTERVEARREAREIKIGVINDLLNQLAAVTKAISRAAPLSEHELPHSDIAYGDLTPEGGATRMTALLSMRMFPGSRPTDKPPIWENANRRKGSKFVQGHLLNENLGGPGRALNLTPITREANAEHERFVERGLKSAVLDEGAVVSYTVTAMYEKHPRRQSQDVLEQRIAATSNEEDRKLAENQLEVMNYEQEHLPRALTCTWCTMKFSDGQWVPDKDKAPGSVLSNLPDEIPEL